MKRAAEYRAANLNSFKSNQSACVCDRRKEENGGRQLREWKTHIIFE
jgi:hypothetical protein